MKELARGRLLYVSLAIPALAGDRVAAKFVFGPIEFREAAYEQIQPAVVVIVKPHGARTPTERGNGGLRRHVGKRAISIVMIENAVRILRHVQIGKAVAIVVAHGNAHSISISRHA